MGTKLRYQEGLRQLLTMEIVLGSFLCTELLGHKGVPYRRQCCASVSLCMMCILDHAKACLVNASDHLYIVLG